MGVNTYTKYQKYTRHICPLNQIADYSFSRSFSSSHFISCQATFVYQISNGEPLIQNWTRVADQFVKNERTNESIEIPDRLPGYPEGLFTRLILLSSSFVLPSLSVFVFPSGTEHLWKFRQPYNHNLADVLKLIFLFVEIDTKDKENECN